MSAGHTPGPWAVWTFGAAKADPRHLAVGPEFGGLAVADVVACSAHGIYTAQTEATGQANAQLIAAAPELLAALQALGDAVQKFTNATPADWSELAQANAAIAQATGGDQA